MFTFTEPKKERVIKCRRKLSFDFFEPKLTTPTITRLVKNQKTEDSFILDDENAIILIDNETRKKAEPFYIMIHERLVDGELVEINRWYQDTYYFGSIHNISAIKELGLFKVQNNCGDFGSLYDYKNDKFIIPAHKFSVLNFGRNDSILKKYNAILGSFAIRTDYEEDDVFSYINVVTGQEMVQNFCGISKNYYAILELDGTIRGNKLFKGDKFSQIEEIIDLDEYESLEEFKKQIKDSLNERKRLSKLHYQRMVEEREDHNESPYLDSEVAKILGIKQ